jgi:hypothetical protein
MFSYIKAIFSLLYVTRYGQYNLQVYERVGVRNQLNHFLLAASLQLPSYN